MSRTPCGVPTRVSSPSPPPVKAAWMSMSSGVRGACRAASRPTVATSIPWRGRTTPPSCSAPLSCPRPRASSSPVASSRRSTRSARTAAACTSSPTSRCRISVSPRTVPSSTMTRKGTRTRSANTISRPSAVTSGSTRTAPTRNSPTSPGRTAHRCGAPIPTPIII